MDKTTTQPTLVGIDDGHAEIKLVVQGKAPLRIPSKARAGKHAVISFSSSGSGDSIDGAYETEGEDFSVVSELNGQGTKFDDYPFSPLNRVLIHHALRMAGLGGKKVRIATGLPLKHFFKNSEPDTLRINKKMASTLVPVSSRPGSPTAEVISSAVVAEGIAAWFDFMLDDNGKLRNDEYTQRTAAVVDIGGRTTDCAVILPGMRVDNHRSGTENIGVLDLYEALERLLRDRFPDAIDFARADVEDAIKTNKFFYAGLQDVQKEVAEAKQEVENQIYREVQRRLGSGADLGTILFVGGGANVFPQLSKRFPNAKIEEAPEFANARGMLKYITYIDNE